MKQKRKDPAQKKMMHRLRRQQKVKGRSRSHAAPSREPFSHVTETVKGIAASCGLFVLLSSSSVGAEFGDVHAAGDGAGDCRFAQASATGPAHLIRMEESNRVTQILGRKGATMNLPQNNAPNVTFRDRIQRLASETMVSDWDNDHGLPIPLDEWVRAWKFYKVSKSLGLPEPFVSPCGDGSIHFCWNDGATEFLLEWKGKTFLWTFRKEGNLNYGQSNDLESAAKQLKHVFE